MAQIFEAEGYTWSQTLQEVTVYVPIPEGTRARDIDCKITKTHINAKLKANATVLIEVIFFSLIFFIVINRILLF